MGTTILVVHIYGKMSSQTLSSLSDLPEEIHPVLYCGKEGTYTCTVQAGSHHAEGVFNVFSETIDNIYSVRSIYYLW